MVEGTLKEEELIKLSEQNLQRVIGWVAAIDTKANYILAIGLVLLGYCIHQVGLLVGCLSTMWNKGERLFPILLFVLTVAAVCVLLISLFYLVFVFKPDRKPHTGRSSLFFFENIAGLSPESFKSRMSSLTLSEVLEDLNDQTYNVSRVVQKKSDQLERSIKWLVAGVVVLIADSILLQVLPKLHGL